MSKSSETESANILGFIVGSLAFHITNQFTESLWLSAATGVLVGLSTKTAVTIYNTFNAPKQSQQAMPTGEERRHHPSI